MIKVDFEKSKVKIAIYIAKVLVLFAVLFFTFVKPTGLILLFYTSMPIYLILYFALFAVLLLLPFGNKKEGLFFNLS